MSHVIAWLRAWPATLFALYAFRQVNSIAKMDKM